jgi:hypothetical protein
MALMFPRVARNFAKNGYFPTDEGTLERVIQAIEPSPGLMSIIDSSAGEGVAIADVAHALGRDRVRAYAVEFDMERASHAQQLADHCLHSDFMDTFISRNSFGLAWMNPPYGDLVRDDLGGKPFKGRARLEKVFYERTVPLLQFGGIGVLIIPWTVLDDEFIGWITKHFGNLQVFRAVDCQFRQVVIFGRRVRQSELRLRDAKLFRDELHAIRQGDAQAPELPSVWSRPRYTVPSSSDEPEHFYRLSLDPRQLLSEVTRLQGLWPDFDIHFGASQSQPRPPARALSPWHLALALTAGAISGVVQSRSGRILVVKGDTHKEKTERAEVTEHENGSITEVRVLTDKFVSVIRAIDMTPGSTTRGQVLTIS